MSSKLLAYHSGKQTEVYTWRSGALSARHVFNADAEGIAEFATHLEKHAELPLYFVVDIIEEDFRLETIPHIQSRSRAALINRKLGQVFRNEAYRHTALQGRDTEGRRDDRLLLSALTNSASIKPWIDTILKYRIALAGIYSVPLLSQAIIEKLGLGKIPHLLLVTRQGEGGLRQSYFQNGYLKLSRLVSLAGNNPDELIDAARIDATAAANGPGGCTVCVSGTFRTLGWCTANSREARRWPCEGRSDDEGPERTGSSSRAGCGNRCSSHRGGGAHSRILGSRRPWASSAMRLTTMNMTP